MKYNLDDKKLRKLAEVDEMKKSGKADFYKEYAYNMKAPISFVTAITSPMPKGFHRIVAEFKRVSPSLGDINSDANPMRYAQIYQRYGAVAMSVLLDSDFKGHYDDLRMASDACNLPCLGKDFNVAEENLYAIRAHGGSAVLFIAAMLDNYELNDLIALAGTLSLDPLVEVHTFEELKRMSSVNTRLIGINNRNLDDMTVDINRTLELLEFVEDGKIIISESGFKTYEQLAKVSEPQIELYRTAEEIAAGREAKYAPKVSAFLISKPMAVSDPGEELLRLQGLRR